MRVFIPAYRKRPSKNADLLSGQVHSFALISDLLAHENVDLSNTDPEPDQLTITDTKPDQLTLNLVDGGTWIKVCPSLVGVDQSIAKKVGSELSPGARNCILRYVRSHASFASYPSASCVHYNTTHLSTRWRVFKEGPAANKSPRLLKAVRCGVGRLVQSLSRLLGTHVFHLAPPPNRTLPFFRGPWCCNQI